ncbi:DegT/DnrJ/EryC1/StrS family aminotransferase [Candidatus Harpocratesius sp.]
MDIPPKFTNWPIWDDQDISMVSNVIKSGNWWCGAPKNKAGNQVWDFQDEFAQYLNANHVFACTNGTHAIEICLRALGIGLGDEVIVSDWTFVASASAVVAVGAIPIFCDIDAKTFLIDSQQIKKLITPKTKAIICVHLGGMPCNLEEILQIAKENDLKIIEDCAHAHGSRYKGKSVGLWGDCGTFSFQASKVLNAGEGGAIICSDDHIANKIYEILDSGRHPGEWFYDHFTFGSDYRLGELNAALLRSQLKKYPKQFEKRNQSAIYLNSALSLIPGVHPQKRYYYVDGCANYVTIFYFDPEYFGGIDYKIMYKELSQAGIPTDACYPPLHRLELFQKVKLLPNIDYSNANWGNEKSNLEHFPVVEKIYRNAFQLDHRVLLSNQAALDYIVETLKKIQEKYSI